MSELLQSHGPFGESPRVVTTPVYLQPPRGRQYILRMPVRHPNTGLQIPPELEWLRKSITQFDDQRYPYYYVTVRSGLVTSVTDDEWHVDGYSMRVPQEPEVDYLWSDAYPTEFLLGNFVPPPSFDPLKHNLHWWLQDYAKGEVFRGDPYVWTKITPYVVHRRPQVPANVWRTMVRLSLIPLEIEDPNATPNPLLPVNYPPRADIRTTMLRSKA